MAVWKQTLVGFEVKINDVDHLPPHELPTKLGRALREVQEDLLEAWENVRIVPPGSSPGAW